MQSPMIRIMLALQLLTTFSVYVTALPITSKPIESTAEQMAWQAWVMLPPEQKSLEKSRKVTPKSIFTLPNRSCPPGHQLFQSNCIPIVNIDEKELLTQQILGFVVEEANGNTNYEYDYDDIGGEIADFIYEQAEKLSGDRGNNRETFHYDQLPSQDEPLKFNIFQQKFPTDYEIESMPSDEPQEQLQLNKSNATESNATISSLAKNVNATKELNTNSTLSGNATNSSGLVDLQMESSNVSLSFAQNSGDTVNPSTEFSVSDIDAIIVPAVPTQNSNLEFNNKNVHKVSLFKDDSSVQLVASTLLADQQQQQRQHQQPDLSLLLKAEDLLPLPNIAGETETDKVGPSSPTTATARTRTPSISIDNDVSTLSTTITNGDDTTTTPLSGNLAADDDEEDVDAVTTFPPLFDGLNESDEKVAIPKETEHDHLKKGDHPRSVKTKNETSELTAPQEEKFTTATEPDTPTTTTTTTMTTTNFQLDETTVDELHDAPTIALKELLELAQHPSAQAHENLGIVVKKSKVEPVEIPPIVYTEPETISSVMTASTATETSTSATNLIVTSTGEVSSSPSPSPSTLVLETSTSTPRAVAKTDRFDNQQLDRSTKVYLNLPAERQRNASSNDEHLVDSNFRDTTTTPTTTSETDIEQELRMINELVKGNSSKRKEQSKDGIIKNERSSTTESSPTAADAIKKSTKTNEKNVDSTTEETTSKRQEDESITSTVKTNSIRTETTETTVATDSTTTATKETTTATKETTTKETTTTTTATLWSKIVPPLDSTSTRSTSKSNNSSSHNKSTPTQSPEIMPSETSLMTSTVASPSTNTVSNDATNANNNRSNRNSKIFRINSVSPSSLSGSDSSMSSNSKTNKKIADKSISSTTTPIPTTTTTKTTESTLADDENNPFWWLPIGWRLDRPAEDENEPSLLLRLWSAFPESDGTSKQRK